MAALDELGATYILERCDPTLSDTAQWCEAYGHTVSSSTSCITVASKKDPKQYAAALVMATARVDVNKRVKTLMLLSKANRPSFAGPDEATDATGGMVPGGVCPFGLPAGMPLFVDSDVLEAGETWSAAPDIPRVLWTGGGSRSLKVGFDPEVLRRIPGVQIVDNLAMP